MATRTPLLAPHGYPRPIWLFAHMATLSFPHVGALADAVAMGDAVGAQLAISSAAAVLTVAAPSAPLPAPTAAEAAAAAELTANRTRLRGSLIDGLGSALAASDAAPAFLATSATLLSEVRGTAAEPPLATS